MAPRLRFVPLWKKVRGRFRLTPESALSVPTNMKAEAFPSRLFRLLDSERLAGLGKTDRDKWMRFSRAAGELEALTDRAEFFLSGPQEDKETAPLFWRQARLLASKVLDPKTNLPPDSSWVTYALRLLALGAHAGQGESCSLSITEETSLVRLLDPSDLAQMASLVEFLSACGGRGHCTSQMLDIASKGLARKCNDIPGPALVDLLFVFCSLRHPCCDFERRAWKSLVGRVESLSVSAISRMFFVHDVLTGCPDVGVLKVFVDSFRKRIGEAKLSALKGVIHLFSEKGKRKPVLRDQRLLSAISERVCSMDLSEEAKRKGSPESLSACLALTGIVGAFDRHQVVDRGLLGRVVPFLLERLEELPGREVVSLWAMLTRLGVWLGESRQRFVACGLHLLPEMERDCREGMAVLGSFFSLTFFLHGQIDVRLALLLLDWSWEVGMWGDKQEHGECGETNREKEKESGQRQAWRALLSCHLLWASALAGSPWGRLSLSELRRVSRVVLYCPPALAKADEVFESSNLHEEVIKHLPPSPSGCAQKVAMEFPVSVFSLDVLLLDDR
uniref:Uncharacterized protein n=1 Tax=Chromera velia CCMP2878 TaxID=1169474 RepID=A0A0G4FKV2_9ALVE|eukprot:Cvel_393.t1-p1 / transcript=Cvel_393.t1 / gene=Cvel_393 / organism=Chromera_velia_CCMP2878 / gene_product=hypothetical protein / transcript_product=hypothetical protein / location=Cvel_scaffold13:3924-6361(+) / protein_length=559 / sequence_SO=supercontig / SO=protein_coding / is_pseudo=false